MFLLMRKRTWITAALMLGLIGAEKLPEVNELPDRAAMPDPLVRDDGSRVTPADWEKRREEMKEIICYYAIGHAPPAPGNVEGKIIRSAELSGGDIAYRLVTLEFGPDKKCSFEMALYVPAELGKINGKFPVIVMPSFFPTPGGATIPAPVTTRPNTRPAFPRSLTPEDGMKPFAEALKRGYAIATFYYQQCGADKPDYRNSGFFPAYPDYDWGDLAAWAWGMSRCVDYLEQQPFADTSKFIALGHSRLGKTTLVAGAFDERFALCAPAGSGCGGTGAYRFNGKNRGGKEGLEEASAHFPQWFGPRLASFSGHVEKLPFDQHWLIDLCAPRRVIIPDGLSDGACNVNALVQSYLASKPAFAMLGVPEHLGINFRPGRHMLAPEDWQAVLDFADQQLMGKKVDRGFNSIPPKDQWH
jgi:hypothetical protein